MQTAHNKNGEENEWYEQKFQGGRSYTGKIYCTNSCANLTASARPSHSSVQESYLSPGHAYCTQTEQMT